MLQTHDTQSVCVCVTNAIFVAFVVAPQIKHLDLSIEIEFLLSMISLTHGRKQKLISNFFSCEFQEKATFPYWCETTTILSGMFPAYLNLFWLKVTHTCEP